MKRVPAAESASALWTIKDVAAYLAVSTRTVEKRRSTGDLPRATRIGRSVRFQSSEVVAWAASLREEC
ncbi:helix-turn-helix transcriptional regulator [Subtercola vilae]|uniref:DNA-binding protein n=1 Tax=Subtercola vilae TaxID=2056433 RepID=A0A4T2C8F6_9MICO|nr:DNA-binding protein [Subtercola vilae]